MSEKKETHPSYALISISRISGNPGHLFGSTIDSHFTSFRMRIYHAVRGTTTGGESHYSAEKRVPIIELEMSASQFIELITSMNVNDGVPCTLRRMGMDFIPHPPPQTMERNKIKDSFRSRVATIMHKLPEMVSSVKEMLEQKNLKKSDRDSIIRKVEEIERETTMNLPYVLEIFDEATDKSVVSAKQEVDNFVTNTLVKIGMEKVQASLIDAPEKQQTVIDTPGESKALNE